MSQVVASSRAAPADLALYVHWPYCSRICPYCDFNVVRARGRVDEEGALADAIVRDLEAQAARLGERRLVSVFFGGGTPSLMDPAYAARIVETARRLFPDARAGSTRDLPPRGEVPRSGEGGSKGAALSIPPPTPSGSPPPPLASGEGPEAWPLSQAKAAGEELPSAPAPRFDLEVTLEANPTDAEAGRFAGFAAAGVNRLSLGVQSLDDEALAFLGRNHSAAEARRAAETAAKAFARLSIDLIYARPGQTAQAWARELQDALAMGPEHVSPYQLTIEQGTAFHRAIARGRFATPEPELGAELFETTQAVLEAAGFEAYEVSNHARGEAARSQHNLAIWRGAEYLGVGPGAHGRVGLGGVRTAARAAPKIGDYVARVREAGVGFETVEPLSAREAAEERVMLGLRIGEGVEVEALTGLGLSGDAAVVRDLVEAGLVRVSGARIAATREGRLVLDRVIAELLTAT